LDALHSHQIAGVALDVFAKEPVDINADTVVAQLATMDNVLLSPHIAWYTNEAGKRLQQSVAQNCQQIVTT
jgi:D-3-phosphoglycerate dehydrogenase